jgi:predicted DsbA family dithiol-disulfide isomerase
MRMSLRLTSDFICPWCFIGERRLYRAIEALSEGIEVQVVYLPYELNPHMPSEGMDRKAYRSTKFGSWERSQAMDAQVAAVGQADGIAFNHDRIMRTPNTFAAHRLVWLAQQRGDPRQLVDDLFRAYFCEGRDIGELAVLAEIAADAGLDRDRAMAFLANDEGAEDVRRLAREAERQGIGGVPHLDIRGTVVTGVQPVRVLVDTLKRAVMAPAVTVRQVVA